MAHALAADPFSFLLSTFSFFRKLLYRLVYRGRRRRQRRGRQLFSQRGHRPTRRWTSNERRQLLPQRWFLERALGGADARRSDTYHPAWHARQRHSFVESQHSRFHAAGNSLTLLLSL